MLVPIVTTKLAVGEVASLTPASKTVSKCMPYEMYIENAEMVIELAGWHT